VLDSVAERTIRLRAGRRLHSTRAQGDAHLLSGPPLPRAANLAVARLFDEIALSLEVAGEQGHRTRAYRRAARAVAAAETPLEVLAAEGRLREIPGIGPALASLIDEYLRTGVMSTHARLVAEHPPGLAPVLHVPGLGPAAAQALHAELGASGLDDIERAARDGRLAAVLGPQRASALLEALPMLRKPVRALRLKSAWEAARQLIDALGAPDDLQVAGQARRGCELVVGGLDLVVAGPPQQTQATFDQLAGLPTVAEISERTADRLVVRLYDEVEVRLHATPEATLGAALVWHSGSLGHLERLQARAAERGWQLRPDGLHGGRPVSVATEETVYAALDLPWIAPELREDAGEIEAAAAGRLPRLIEPGDLQGDLHCHTEWTDGTEPLEAMARAAQARGYAYMALTDHSQALAITNGLNLARLEEARRHVQQLNHTLAPFQILLGTEMDILADGQLDYPDETLASLDYVSASIHSRFKQPEPVMTARILRAVQHPLVHTLNHPHGRLLTSRPAYAVDMARVIEAAASAGCALEVSADPARMDLDGGWARRVKAAGGRCTISSDAHSTRDYDNIWLGITSARRGWLEAADVLNARPLDALRALLRRPRLA